MRKTKKEFICKCGKHFTRKSNLNRHLLTCGCEKWKNSNVNGVNGVDGINDINMVNLQIVDKNTNISPNYVYILREREFIKTGENIYKIGKTKKDYLARFTKYPKGSNLLLFMPCINCDQLETVIINLFIDKYKQRKDIGKEYFEGDFKKMARDICKLVM